jgi:hypothetical protein
MNDLDFSKLPPKNLPSLNYINKHLDDALKSVQEAHEEKVAQEKAYRNELISLLKSIESNTANLNSLVELIKQNVNQQDDIIEIITDILSIAKARQKEEAETKFQKVMKRITGTITDAETLSRIVPYALSLYGIVSNSL